MVVDVSAQAIHQTVLRTGRLDAPSIRALVGAVEHQRRVEWSLLNAPHEAEISLYCHLPPPQRLGSSALNIWSERHRRYGLFFRRGPQFIVVKDQRLTDNASLFYIRGQLIACVEELRDSTSHRCARCDSLVEASLAVDIDGCRVFLVPRMLYPPIPALAV